MLYDIRVQRDVSIEKDFDPLWATGISFLGRWYKCNFISKIDKLGALRLIGIESKI